MSSPGSFYLSFLLPKGAVIADSAERVPLVYGCMLRVVAPLVKINGPSREAVFEQAAELIRLTCSSRGGTSLAATLQTPAGGPLAHTTADKWSIILGADVAFSPTSLDAHFPRAPTA